MDFAIGVVVGFFVAGGVAVGFYRSDLKKCIQAEKSNLAEDIRDELVGIIEKLEDYIIEEPLEDEVFEEV